MPILLLWCLMSDVDLKFYSYILYHNEELNSLERVHTMIEK